MSRLKPVLLLALGALIITTGLAQAAGPSFTLKKLGLLQSFKSLVLLPSRDPRDDRHGTDNGDLPIAKLGSDWETEHGEQNWTKESDAPTFTPESIEPEWHVESAKAPGIPAPNLGPVSSHGLTLAP